MERVSVMILEATRKSLLEATRRILGEDPHEPLPSSSASQFKIRLLRSARPYL
jgi:hypothetical protein